MNQSQKPAIDTAKILADMVPEFIESCKKRFAEVDACLARLHAREGSAENHILEVKRHVHSMKGMGTTFQFPSITRVARALEDYFETDFEMSETGFLDVRLFIDAMRDIIESGTDLPHDETLEMLRHMPLSRDNRTPG